MVKGAVVKTFVGSVMGKQSASRKRTSEKVEVRIETIFD